MSKNVLCRGSSKCKGSEAGTNLAHGKNKKEANMISSVSKKRVVVSQDIEVVRAQLGVLVYIRF